LRAKIGRVGQVAAWEHAVAHDALLVIDVIDEHVQRPGSLLQSGLDASPLIECNHPRYDVERPGAVDRTALLVVDGECDAHAADRDVGGLLPRGELI